MTQVMLTSILNGMVAQAKSSFEAAHVTATDWSKEFGEVHLVIDDRNNTNTQGTIVVIDKGDFVDVVVVTGLPWSKASSRFIVGGDKKRSTKRWQGLGDQKTLQRYGADIVKWAKSEWPNMTEW
jgi:hypothetical protein